jgi:glyoxylase-like metal-dependent hydrolase (beta-lactamase superfamily II)
MSDIQIVRVPIVPFGIVNAHIIVGRRGCVVVDAGTPGSERKIERALKAKGLTVRDIRLVVVTHAHVDHAGGALALRELSGAPIMGHRQDTPYFRGEEAMTFCTTDWFSRIFLRLGVVQQPYPAFTPDVVLESGECRSLDAYGVEGQVRHTPGHTEGSISVEMSEHAFVGDLLASGIMVGGIAMTGTAKRPPFEDDPHRVSAELERMVGAGFRQFYMGHGGPLGAAEVRRHARRLGREPRRTTRALPSAIVDR